VVCIYLVQNCNIAPEASNIDCVGVSVRIVPDIAVGGLHSLTKLLQGL
jgi:hypothetical protein